MRRKTAAVLCLAALLLMFILPVHAAREGVRGFLRADIDSPIAGETIFCTFGLAADVDIDAAVFRVRFQFDEAVLDYKGIEAVAPAASGELNVREEPGALTVIFVRDGDGIPLPGGAETAFFCLKFQVRRDASLGESPLTSALDGVGTEEVQAVPVLENGSCSLFVCTKSEEVCRLTSLVPSVGSLSPEFSPDVLRYELPVPGNVKQVTFEAAAEEEDAVIRFNRRTVERNQPETNITVTVISAKSGARLVYEVAVQPVLPDVSDAGAPEPGPEEDAPGRAPDGSWTASGVWNTSTGGASENSGGGNSPAGWGSDLFVADGDRFSVFLQAFLLCAVLFLIAGFLFRGRVFGKKKGGKENQEEREQAGRRTEEQEESQPGGEEPPPEEGPGKPRKND